MSQIQKRSVKFVGKNTNFLIAKINIFSRFFVRSSVHDFSHFKWGRRFWSWISSAVGLPHPALSAPFLQDLPSGSPSIFFEAFLVFSCPPPPYPCSFLSRDIHLFWVYVRTISVFSLGSFYAIRSLSFSLWCPYSLSCPSWCNHKPILAFSFLPHPIFFPALSWCSTSLIRRS